MATPIGQTSTSRSKNTEKPGRASARPRRSKSPWKRFAGRVDGFMEFLSKLDKISRTPAKAEHVPALKNLGESLPTHRTFDALTRSLMGLDGDGVPLPRPARFSVGDLVQVKKARVKLYTAFVEASVLSKLRIERISDDGKQFLCREVTTKDREPEKIVVRSPGHLVRAKD